MASKLKIATIWSFVEKFANPWSIRSITHNYHLYNSYFVDTVKCSVLCSYYDGGIPRGECELTDILVFISYRSFVI